MTLCHNPPRLDSCIVCQQLARSKSFFNSYVAMLREESNTENMTQSTQLVNLCNHLGEATGELVPCTTCTGNVSLKLFHCNIHKECTIKKRVRGIACCNSCGNFLARPSSPSSGVVVQDRSSEQSGPGQYDKEPPREDPTFSQESVSPNTQKIIDTRMEEFRTRPRPVRWAYGVTTVPSRRDTLLPNTLKSLRLAGFDKPRLFVDGARNDDAKWWEDRYGLEVTVRSPVIRLQGNFMLGLYELFVRSPESEFYAMFQDDFVTYRNLREYLERQPYPDGNSGARLSDGTKAQRGYLNLYEFEQNRKLAPVDSQGRTRVGWYESNQLGRGAVALVFNRDAVMTLLLSDHMLGRPMNAHRGYKTIDGGIIDSFKKAGWKEYVHHPSLVQHTGRVSTLGNLPHQLAKSFRGEDMDALELEKRQ